MRYPEHPDSRGGSRFEAQCAEGVEEARSGAEVIAGSQGKKQGREAEVKREDKESRSLCLVSCREGEKWDAQQLRSGWLRV